MVSVLEPVAENDTEPYSPEALAVSLNAQHGGSHARHVVEAALSLFGSRIALVSSFGAESAVLLHMIASIAPETPVIFLDTGRLFARTMLYRKELARLLGLKDLRTAHPRASLIAQEDPDRLLAYRDPDMCCWIRKVDPLDTALEPFAAWITGRKRHQAATRSTLSAFEADAGRLKVNPLADWTTADVNTYMQEHQLPQHPLVAEGYLSIGCIPCTSRVRPGEDARAGRWRGNSKTECGIHVSPEKSGSGI